MEEGGYRQFAIMNWLLHAMQCLIHNGRGIGEILKEMFADKWIPKNEPFQALYIHRTWPQMDFEHMFSYNFLHKI